MDLKIHYIFPIIFWNKKIKHKQADMKVYL